MLGRMQLFLSVGCSKLFLYTERKSCILPSIGIEKQFRASDRKKKLHSAEHRYRETVSLYRCSAECNFFFRSDARNCFSIPMLGRMQLFLSVGCSKLFRASDRKKKLHSAEHRYRETVSSIRPKEKVAFCR